MERLKQVWRTVKWLTLSCWVKGEAIVAKNTKRKFNALQSGFFRPYTLYTELQIEDILHI